MRPHLKRSRRRSLLLDSSRSARTGGAGPANHPGVRQQIRLRTGLRSALDRLEVAAQPLLQNQEPVLRGQNVRHVRSHQGPGPRPSPNAWLKTNSICPAKHGRKVKHLRLRVETDQSMTAGEGHYLGRRLTGPTPRHGHEHVSGRDVEACHPRRHRHLLTVVSGRRELGEIRDQRLMERRHGLARDNSRPCEVAATQPLILPGGIRGRHPLGFEPHRKIKAHVVPSADTCLRTGPSLWRPTDNASAPQLVLTAALPRAEHPAGRPRSSCAHSPFRQRCSGWSSMVVPLTVLGSVSRVAATSAASARPAEDGLRSHQRLVGYPRGGSSGRRGCGRRKQSRGDLRRAVSPPGRPI